MARGFRPMPSRRCWRFLARSQLRHRGRRKARHLRRRPLMNRPDKPKPKPRCWRAAVSGACKARSTRRGVTNAVSGLCRRRGGCRPLPVRQFRRHRPRGSGEDCLRSWSKISYGKLLQVYFSVAHDPTELNSPGAGCRHAIPHGDLPGE